jgi:hypothetical protein
VKVHGYLPLAAAPPEKKKLNFNRHPSVVRGEEKWRCNRILAQRLKRQTMIPAHVVERPKPPAVALPESNLGAAPRQP